MVGRLLSGTGVAVAANAAPSYVTEMSPPQWRGRMGGMYNVSLWSIISFVINLIIYNTLRVGIMLGLVSYRSNGSCRRELRLLYSIDHWYHGGLRKD